MKTATTVCGKCRAEIPADARQGACPACLLETGLGLLTDEAVAGDDSSAVAAYSAEATAKAGSAKADDPGRSASPMPATARRPKLLGNFGDYELLEEIGRGGQGVVYRARQKSLNRTVALKVISLGYWATEAHLKRFRREAEAAASLDHPSIVPIYEVGERDGCCYFSMKFIEGGQLDEVVSRAPMSIRQAAELIAKVARTVHYAHEHGILHRDIKPGNVLLDQKGEAHLTDFGLARLVETESTVTRTKEVLGTPSYMAPEQAVGETRNLTSATDVYGLGAVLYQLLTGHPPFAGGTTYETIQLLLDTEPRPPRLLNRKIDRNLSTICLKCLEKEPARRYASAELLAEELDRFCRGEPILARPVGWAERSWRWCRREPALAGLAAALVVVLIIGFAGVVWKWRGEVSQREFAQQENQRAQRAVTRLEIERAESLLEAGDSSRGLAYLARLLRQQPTNHVVAERLMSALTYRSFCLPVAPLRHGKALNSLAREQKEWFRRTEFFPFRFSGSLVMANFSPDSWQVVTASEDGTARLWNALTGESLGGPMRHEAEVLWEQFSGDGQRIVTASVDGSARIWRADTSQLAAPPLRHGDVVHFATFSPDGQKVVTASRDNTVRIWKAQTGQPIGPPLIHPKPVYSACFSPDGSRILTADESEHARLWDERTGTAIAAADHFDFFTEPAPFPQFSPSGEQVVTFRRHQAFLRNPRSEMVVLARLQHDSFLTSAIYSPDGQRIATVSDDSTARIWDAGTGEASISPLRHDSPVFMAHFSSDGQRIVTGSGDKSARLWNVRQNAGTVGINQVAVEFSPNGKMIATSSPGATVQIWDAATGRPLGKPLQHADDVFWLVSCLAIMPLFYQFVTI